MNHAGWKILLELVSGGVLLASLVLTNRVDSRERTPATGPQPDSEADARVRQILMEASQPAPAVVLPDLRLHHNGVPIRRCCPAQ
jgi:hypothetical protein